MNWIKDLVIGEAGGREEGDCLVACNGVHSVDGRNDGLDHGLGLVTREGVNRHVIYVEVGLRKHVGGGVNDLAGPVERPPQHLPWHINLQDIVGELAVCPLVIDVGCAFELLDNNTGAGHLEDLSGALDPII